MRKNFRFILWVLLLTPCKICLAQQPFLTIYSSMSEKSKDSHSTIENISLTGNTAVYTVKYTGRKGPDQKDEKKECVFSNEQANNIRKVINERKLNITDSLISDAVVYESYRTATTIIISFTNGNKTTKTKVKGDPVALADKLLYKNSVYLLYLVKRIVKDCL